MPTLSACLILKEYNSFIMDTLRQVAPYFDEFIIATQDKKFVKDFNGVELDKAKFHVFHYPWRSDFAHARNTTFDKATGDYLMWWDGDDKIINPENLPKVVAKMERERIDWCFLEYLYEKDELGRVIMRQWSPRIMKKGSGEWRKPVHETFIEHGSVNKVMMPDVQIDHHTTEHHRKEHGERNLKILVEEWKRDKDDTDPRTLYYIGNTLLALERFAEAVPFYHAHIQKCGWPEEKYFSMYYLSQCFMLLGQYDQAINTMLTATKLFPNWSLAYFALGQYYTLQAEEHGDRLDWKRGIEWLEVGLKKQKPDTKAYFTNDLDYSLIPLARLSEAYAQVGEYDKALGVAERLATMYPEDKSVQELVKTSHDLFSLEDFVQSFITVAQTVGNKDRIKGAKLFDCIPNDLDEDYRLQNARKALVPPKAWPEKSIVIYCHNGLEDWGPPSLYTGVGGSEEAVIHMSNQLTQLGYKVTVYNRCGDYRGTYKGVDYVPYYHFNARDSFDTLIVWRYPEFLDQPLRAKKKFLWLHDIVGLNLFNERILANVDKVFFLSKWHRNNVPDLPEDKVFITNNGIDPKQFESVDESKRRPNSMVYTSSYDRGALTLLRDIFPKIREAVPTATLDICYGMANIEKQMHAFPHLQELYNEIVSLLKQPGVTHHGRISHAQVAELEKTSVLHIYPTEFGETNFIGSQKAQAGGAYILTTMQSGGAPERVRYGEAMVGEGIYSDKEFQQRFIDRAIALLKAQPKLTEAKRKKIMDEFSWEATARQWDEEIKVTSQVLAKVVR